MKKKLIICMLMVMFCCVGVNATIVSARTSKPTATKDMNESSANKFTLNFDAGETLYSNFKYLPFTYSKGTYIELRMSNTDEACIKVTLYDDSAGKTVTTIYTSDEDYDNEFRGLNPKHKYYFIFKNCSKYDCEVYCRVF
ncbi:hypothetical protein [Anaeromicropila populeti]|uniref:Uncharacterized protein n=1 Tax=Anaeromicropila populeti TaxID=37658 RepID=A0A1I6IMW2_9FIRM|nr:hypothetical protein [Anaeromicropila populeti]SFR68056.1 hypothetical protein SAMN05661086_00920 [Anaeromicropila populeti]